MKLNIRVLNRAKHWRIDVSPHINISELKQEVEKYCKMKLNKANMYYRSMELSKDEQTLKDYGVVAESSIIVRFTTIIILENLVKRSSLDKIITEMMNNKNLPKLKRKYNYNCGVKNASIDCTNLDSILESLLIAYEYMTPALEELINNASDSVLPKLYNEKLDEIVWSISPEQFDEIVKASLLIKEVNKCRVLEYATKLPKFPIDSFICAINQSIRFSITAGIFRIYLKEDVVTQLALLYKALHDAIQRINQLSDCRKTDQLVYFVKEHKSKNLQDLQNNTPKKPLILVRLEAEYQALCDAINIFKSAMQETASSSHCIDSNSSSITKHFSARIQNGNLSTSSKNIDQCVTDASGARRCIFGCLCELTEVHKQLKLLASDNTLNTKDNLHDSPSSANNHSENLDLHIHAKLNGIPILSTTLTEAD